MIEIAHFTDPACPWAFSAEPVRLRLRWHYGEALVWRHRMIVLSEDPEEYVRRGFTPELLAQGAASIQRRFGMPLRADMRAARSPSRAARALDHKLAGPPEERRYTAPSYELSCDGVTLSVPGFNAVEAYEAAIANLAPELERRPKPETAEEVLAWAGEPLATAEVALLVQREPDVVRAELARVAHALPAGADTYWTLAARQLAA